MKDSEIMEALEEQAGEEKNKSSMEFDSSAFSEEKTEEPGGADYQEQPEGPIPGIDVPKPMTIAQAMEELGISKDEVIAMILDLTDKGFIEEEEELFHGKVKIKFRTSKLSDSGKFIDMFDGLTINKQAKAEYFLNLYSLTGILAEYNGEDLWDMEVNDRAEWVSDNIPVPIYRFLLEKATKFHAKIELLGSKEVADFF